MAKKKPTLVNLEKMNLSFEDKDQTIKLLNFKTQTLCLDTAIYEKEVFIANRTMVYAHLPRKLKSELNKYF
jgi:hypothetical protein